MVLFSLTDMNEDVHMFGPESPDCMNGERFLVRRDSGMAYAHFKKTGDYYSWRKMETYINSIIVGKLWIDHNGRSVITNHTNKDYCELIVEPKTKQVRL